MSRRGDGKGCCEQAAAPRPWHTFIMTEIRRCRWCASPLPDRTGRGRPREFCSAACRQWDWVARRRDASRGTLGGDGGSERAELDDELFVLACAVDDTERDLAEAGEDASAVELRAIVGWLLEASRPLRARSRGRAQSSVMTEMTR